MAGALLSVVFRPRYRRRTDGGRGSGRSPAADLTVGRDYHTEALFLPDGRVAVFGSDPLFADKADSRPGHFEQRVEVYTPPYLFHGARPALARGGRPEAERGEEVTFDSTDTARITRITRIRLMRPGSATHVTDFDQRSIALDVIRHTGRSLTVRIPGDPSLVPSGWYMTIATDGRGTPSQALWLHIH
ncbi:galactose oxidase early set domain-containing protein [Streptomyces sp. NPDC051554]|uniref:galactose oxidase early set domain-containing protein n=1 Tax=Streptomyces sp. NPDC051554 TaxID=3365656 RepID=UPI0037A2FEF1